MKLAQAVVPLAAGDGVGAGGVDDDFPPPPHAARDPAAKKASERLAKRSVKRIASYGTAGET
jgi:hypothetical protein